MECLSVQSCKDGGSTGIICLWQKKYKLSLCPKKKLLYTSTTGVKSLSTFEQFNWWRHGSLSLLLQHRQAFLSQFFASRNISLFWRAAKERALASFIALSFFPKGLHQVYHQFTSFVISFFSRSCSFLKRNGITWARWLRSVKQQCLSSSKSFR